MKKIIAITCALILTFCLFGCTDKKSGTDDKTDTSKTNPTIDYYDKSWANIPSYSSEFPTEEDMEQVYKLACEAFGWIALTAAPPLDTEDMYEVEGLPYFRVESEYLQSLSDLELYYKTLFSDDIVEILLDVNKDIKRFIEGENGGLYSMGFTYKPVGFSEEETFEFTRVRDDCCYYDVYYSLLDNEGNKTRDASERFIYEKVDGRWIFTTFRVYRQN